MGTAGDDWPLRRAAIVVSWSYWSLCPWSAFLSVSWFLLEQLNSLRAEGAMHRKEQEKLSQVKAVVKVRPKQDKLFSKKGAKLDKLLLVKGKSVPSRLKSKTLRISEVRRHYKLTSDEANHLDAYSECRPEQVIDRQDTHEEHRLLRRVSTERANLQWNSEFSRSRREMHNCLTVVAYRHSFTQCWHKLKFEAYCEANNPIVTMTLREIYLQRNNGNITGK
uniref:Uncharacterized protein n=1 Tax=Aegilops tauschii TaxID=37682 RepID=M8BES0_AEGTA